MPHHPHHVAAIFDPEGSRTAGGTESGVGSRRVSNTVLHNHHVADRFAAAQRDITERALERPGEIELDLLGHQQRSIG